MEMTVARKAQINIAEVLGKPRLVAVLFCDYLDRTKEGKSNLAGAFDIIYVDPERKRTPPFFLFVRTAETGSGPLEVTFFDPNGAAAAATFKASHYTPTPGQPGHMQVLARIQIDTPVEGVYWVDVSHHDQPLGGAALTVEFRKQEEQNGIDIGTTARDNVKFEDWTV
ncbi:MAG: DUF6941 family protein [Blastocatellia bacterium]